MAGTTVTVDTDDDEPAETTTDTSEVISAVDAHVAANDAEDSAEVAQAHSDDAEAQAFNAWLAAESAWETEQSVNATATAQAEQIAALQQVASDLVIATENLARATSSGTNGALPDPGPDGIPGTADDEVPPDNQHWLSRKWFGGKR